MKAREILCYLAEFIGGLAVILVPIMFLLIVTALGK